jgi:benzoyl-CoA reductase subunit C
MKAESVLEHCRQLIAEPLGMVAERWKAARPGGRAVAVYPVWAPTELIHAAGMLPLALLGGGASVELTQKKIQYYPLL